MARMIQASSEKCELGTLQIRGGVRASNLAEPGSNLTGGSNRALLSRKRSNLALIEPYLLKMLQISVGLHDILSLVVEFCRASSYQELIQSIFFDQ